MLHPSQRTERAGGRHIDVATVQQYRSLRINASKATCRFDYCCADHPGDLHYVSLLGIWEPVQQLRLRTKPAH